MMIEDLEPFRARRLNSDGTAKQILASVGDWQMFIQKV